MKKRRKIDLNTVALVIVCIPILLVAIWGATLIFLVVLSSIKFSGYVGNVNELTAQYGVSTDLCNIEAQGQFYYAMRHMRIRDDVRHIYIYGKVPLDKINQIVLRDWDWKYAVRNADTYVRIGDDLPEAIEKDMNLTNGESISANNNSMADKTILLCCAERDDYDVFLAIGAESGTLVMGVFQYPCGKAEAPICYFSLFNRPAEGLYPMLTEDILNNISTTTPRF